MHGPDEYKNRIELLQGTLDLIILKTLQYGSQHGYGISQAIKTNSSDTFVVETGSLYPALHRLEKQGYIESDWDVSDNKQRAKYYKLTQAGRKHLHKEQSRWAKFVAAMTGIMKSRQSEG